MFEIEFGIAKYKLMSFGMMLLLSALYAKHVFKYSFRILTDVPGLLFWDTHSSF